MFVSLDFVEAVHGIPVAYDWVYVGRSTRLTTRFIEHLPVNETNPGLQDWIRRHQNGMVVRYVMTSLVDSINLEQILIGKLEPKFNRIKYKKGVKNGNTTIDT